MPQGVPSSYKKVRDEPAHHGIGRSLRGLSTKIHHHIVGRGLPLVVPVGPGQAGDAPTIPIFMRHLRVTWPSQGRPRTRRDRVRGRQGLLVQRDPPASASRGIVAVIPQPSDQQGHRKRRGSKGGRHEYSFLRGPCVVRVSAGVRARGLRWLAPVLVRLGAT